MSDRETEHSLDDSQHLDVIVEQNPSALSPEIARNIEVPVPRPTPVQEDSSDIATTFSLFKNYLDKKLSTLKQDLKDEGQSSTDSVVKKLKESAEISFKYEGNKQQHKFNSSLSDHVATAKKALGRKKYSQVSDTLDELDKGIKKRNKLIRLADKSPSGWDLVNEYLSDELASDSEDEKRIRKAEQTALRKKNQKKLSSKPPRVRSNPYTSTSTAYTSPTTVSQTGYLPSSSQRSTFTRFLPRKAAPTDICFACGLQGHWRIDCRKTTSKVNQASGSRNPAGGNA